MAKVKVIKCEPTYQVQLTAKEAEAVRTLIYAHAAGFGWDPLRQALDDAGVKVNLDLRPGGSGGNVIFH